MAEQMNPKGGSPARRIGDEEAPRNGQAPDPGGAGDADTAAKPNDDRVATEMAAALIESENGDADEAPSDTEASRDPA